MSPEYVVDEIFSMKSDVYSFGVILLEMLSRKRNRGFTHPDHHLNLLGHVSITNEVLIFYFNETSELYGANFEAPPHDMPFNIIECLQQSPFLHIILLTYHTCFNFFQGMDTMDAR